MLNKSRRILYKLSESNSNNPANLLVGQSIIIKQVSSGDELSGVIELITNNTVVVRLDHTQNNYDFVLVGYNAHENAIEFNCISDSDFKFYVYN